jgi:hypothetical protein
MERTLFRSMLILGLALAFSAPAASQTAFADTIRRCYVRDGFAGTPDGGSWLSPYPELRDALADPTCKVIWVAAGEYKPGTLATDSFVIADRRELYGGFQGLVSETTLEDRNPAIHRTVLSGDIDDNDTTDGHGIVQNYSDIVGTNSHHVVTMDGTATPPCWMAS